MGTIRNMGLVTLLYAIMSNTPSGISQEELIGKISNYGKLYHISKTEGYPIVQGTPLTLKLIEKDGNRKSIIMYLGNLKNPTMEDHNIVVVKTFDSQQGWNAGYPNDIMDPIYDHLKSSFDNNPRDPIKVIGYYWYKQGEPLKVVMKGILTDNGAILLNRK